MWLLRDFSLKLQIGGREVTATEYLENFLQPIQSGDMNSRNLVRESIKKYFVRRSCFVLKKPVNEDNLLKELDSLDETKLRPQFLNSLSELKNVINGAVREKKVFGKQISGHKLGIMAQNYVDAINKGAIPCISSSWESATKSELSHVMAKITQDWRKQNDEMEQSMPVPEEEIEEKLHVFSTKCLMSLVNVSQEQKVLEKIIYLNFSMCSKIKQENKKRALEMKKLAVAKIDLCTCLDSLNKCIKNITSDEAMEYFAEKYGRKTKDLYESIVETRCRELTTQITGQFKQFESEKEKTTVLLSEHRKSFSMSRDEVKNLSMENARLIDLVTRLSEVIAEK